MSESFNMFKELVRAYTLPMSVAPFLVALCISYNPINIITSPFLFASLLILLSVLSIHMFVNLFDDYFDIKQKLKKGINLAEINFKSKRKARLILNGTYSLAQVEQILVMLLIIPVISLLFFFIIRGAIILPYAILAFLSGIFYPLSSKFGLSEIIVGIMFGPLLILGTILALNGYIPTGAVMVSISSGIITTILHITHGIMEFEYDKDKGKKTLAVMVDNKYLTINLISILILIAYFILFLFAKDTSHIIRYGIVPVLTSVYIAYKLIVSIYDYIVGPLYIDVSCCK